MTRSKSALLLSLALTLSAGAALADSAEFDFVAKTRQTSESFMTGTEDGVFHIASEWSPIEAPGTAFDGVTGSCFGAAILVGGGMTGDGYCAYTDPAGDKIMLRWWIANSIKPMGFWQLTGGTGKWQTAIGGGRWADAPGDREGTGTTHVTGMVDFQ